MDIKLPQNLAAEIKARAEDQGREPEAYVIGLLWRAVVELDPLKPKKKGNKTKKGPLVPEVADHDWSDTFKFSDPTESGSTIDELRTPVNVTKE